MNANFILTPESVGTARVGHKRAILHQLFGFFAKVYDMARDLGLLSPERSSTAHLHALASISRMMRDERMHQALFEAPGTEALFGLLTNATEHNAA